MVKVVKLKLVKPLDYDWKEVGQIFNDFDYDSYQIKNKTVNLYHEKKMQIMRYKEIHGISMPIEEQKKII